MRHFDNLASAVCNFGDGMAQRRKKAGISVHQVNKLLNINATDHESTDINLVVIDFFFIFES